MDDDVAIRVLVTHLLRRRDFVVDTAGDGADAIEKISSASYSVIILDLMVPRVDGIGVLKYLAEHHPAQLATVIVLTAFGTSAAERVEPPPARFLTKPFDIDVLVAEVAECVGRRAVADRRLRTTSRRTSETGADEYRRSAGELLSAGATTARADRAELRFRGGGRHVRRTAGSEDARNALFIDPTLVGRHDLQPHERPRHRMRSQQLQNARAHW